MYKLLAADDAVDELNVLVFLIQRFKLPFEILTARDGAEAIRLLKSSLPDVILTDIQMPLADGLEIAAAAREYCPDAVTVIISAHDDFSYARTAIQLGVEDYLLKPINPPEIEAVLKKVLDKLDRKNSQKKLNQMEKMFVRKHLLTQIINSPSGEQDSASLPLAREYLSGYDTACLFCAAPGYFENHLEEFEQFVSQKISGPLLLNISDTSEYVLFRQECLSGGSSPEQFAVEVSERIRQRSRSPVRSAVGSLKGLDDIRACCQDLAELTDSAYRFPGHTVLRRSWTDELRKAESDRLSENSASARSRIHEIRQYISEHYGEPLSLETLAGVVYVNPDYLSRIFKKETGQNLNQYLRMYRMEKAKELLCRTHRKVSEIGRMVGYSNSSYFGRSFSDYTGVTPEKYREKSRQKEGAE